MLVCKFKDINVNLKFRRLQVKHLYIVLQSALWALYNLLYILVNKQAKQMPLDHGLNRKMC